MKESAVYFIGKLSAEFGEPFSYKGELVPRDAGSRAVTVTTITTKDGSCILLLSICASPELLGSYGWHWGV